jgi:hypothetical protein
MEDSTIMSPGDFITTDGNKLYNITTGLSYNNIPNINNLKYCLEAVTDEPISNYKTDYDLFVDITKNMSETFKKKNHDYGNSFEESLNEEGLAASRIRIGDKWNRYKTLSKGIQKQVNDESIRDTLLDMANYAIMTVMWLDKQK